MKHMPSCKELKYLASKFDINQRELIIFKILLDLQSKYLQFEESAPFKNQIKYLLPAAKNFFKKRSEVEIKMIKQVSKDITSGQKKAPILILESKEEYLQHFNEKFLSLQSMVSCLGKNFKETKSHQGQLELVNRSKSKIL